MYLSLSYHSLSSVPCIVCSLVYELCLSLEVVAVVVVVVVVGTELYLGLLSPDNNSVDDETGGSGDNHGDRTAAYQ